MEDREILVSQSSYQTTGNDVISVVLSYSSQDSLADACIIDRIIPRKESYIAYRIVLGYWILIVSIISMTVKR